MARCRACGLGDMVRSPTGSLVFLADEGDHRAALLVEANEAGAGRWIPVPLTGTELHLAAGEGDRLWVGGTVNQRRGALGDRLSEAYLVKLNTRGQVAWERTFGGNSERTIQGVSSLPSDDVAVVGQDDDKSWLARISADGQIVWEHRFGSGALTSVTTVGGHIFVAGFDRVDDHAVGHSQVNLVLWRFDGRGQPLGRDVIHENVGNGARVWPLWFVRQWASSDDAVYVFALWSEQLAANPLDAVKVTMQGQVVWRRQLPQSVLQARTPPVDRGREAHCIPKITILANGNPLIACSTDKAIVLSELDAATGDVSQASLERNRARTGGSVAQILQKSGEILWLFGQGGTRCGSPGTSRASVGTDVRQRT